MQTKRITTRQRVLNTSAELFNRYGVEAVSISQIAEGLKISAGNLTYHFEKKVDLIAAHVDAFELQMRTSIEQFPFESDAKTFSSAYMDLLGITLRYRFLFVGANYLIGNDLLDATRYQRIIDTTKHSFIHQSKRLIADGYMSAVQKPYSLEMLIDCTWWQWLGWLMVMQITPPGRLVPERRLLADAVTHIFFLTHHYVDQTFFKAVQVELKHFSNAKS